MYRFVYRVNLHWTARCARWLRVKLLDAQGGIEKIRPWDWVLLYCSACEVYELKWVVLLNPDSLTANKMDMWQGPLHTKQRKANQSESNSLPTEVIIVLLHSFVGFSSEEEVNNAIQTINGTRLGDHLLTVERAIKRDRGAGTPRRGQENLYQRKADFQHSAG